MKFHKGTIRTPSEPTEERLINYFNSIKVQLELRSQGNGVLVKSFQFHKGTIRTKKEKKINLLVTFLNKKK